MASGLLNLMSGAGKWGWGKWFGGTVRENGPEELISHSRNGPGNPGSAANAKPLQATSARSNPVNAAQAAKASTSKSRKTGAPISLWRKCFESENEHDAEDQGTVAPLCPRALPRATVTPAATGNFGIMLVRSPNDFRHTLLAAQACVPKLHGRARARGAGGALELEQPRQQPVLNGGPKLNQSSRTDPTQNEKSKKRDEDWRQPVLVIKSAMTYFPAEQYHRQQELNCCVRYGNRCLLLLIVTDNP